MFQLCFNFNRIHDSVGKALRTANQDRVTANSHTLSSSLALDLLSFQLKCSSNIDSIHYLGLTNSFDQVPRNIHTLPSKIVNFLLNSLNAPITFVVCATNQS